jgi:hypothetical protein
VLEKSLSNLAVAVWGSARLKEVGVGLDLQVA